MARPPKAILPPAEDGFSAERLEEAGEAARQLAAIQLEAKESTLALAKQLGYEGSLSPDVLEEGVRQSQRRVEIEVFAIGAGLLLLKEQCPHGEFMERCERLGVIDRMARKLMRSALKFSNRPTSADLAKLGKSKLFELLVLDDEETEEFVAGGSVRGITYDSAAKMSVSELRKALREAEARLTAKDTVTANQQETITKLQEDLVLARTRPGLAARLAAGENGEETSAWDEAVQSVEAEVREIAIQIASSLRSQFVQLGAPELGVGDVIRKQVIGAAIGRIIAVTRQQAADFDIAVSGPESVDAESPWDEIWAMTLRDFDAKQPAKGAPSADDGDAIEA